MQCYNVTMRTCPQGYHATTRPRSNASIREYANERTGSCHTVRVQFIFCVWLLLRRRIARLVQAFCRVRHRKCRLRCRLGSYQSTLRLSSTHQTLLVVIRVVLVVVSILVIVPVILPSSTMMLMFAIVMMLMLDTILTLVLFLWLVQSICPSLSLSVCQIDRLTD